MTEQTQTDKPFNTRTQLLKVIIDNPDEDTPRLAYADWLDEHGDAQDRARAEFIRVQVEITQNNNMGIKNYTIADNDRRRWLHNREKELLTANEAQFRRCGVPCPTCAGSGKILAGGRGNGDRYTNPYDIQCPHCHGSGDAGGDLAGQWDFPVHFRRGFPYRVGVPTLVWAVKEHDPSRSKDAYFPSKGLTRILTHHPVMEVVPLDLDCDDMRIDADGVPMFAFYSQDLPDEMMMYSNDFYSTRDAAVTALARTIVMWARECMAKK